MTWHCRGSEREFGQNKGVNRNWRAISQVESPIYSSYIDIVLDVEYMCEKQSSIVISFRHKFCTRVCLLHLQNRMNETLGLSRIPKSPVAIKMEQTYKFVEKLLSCTYI